MVKMVNSIWLACCVFLDHAVVWTVRYEAARFFVSNLYLVVVSYYNPYCSLPGCYYFLLPFTEHMPYDYMADVLMTLSRYSHPS